jgi:RNA polymerase sigma-70 factor (ECF subfamily)
MLYARLYLETSDRERAEDLVQETYLTAWRSIGQLREVPDASAFRRWLFAIARTARIDSARHDARKKRAGPKSAGGTEAHDDLLAGLRDPSPSPDDAMERREKQEQVIGLLRSLAEENRAPIAMRYLSGADYATIGRQLGLSNGSLRGLLNRGMARLRQLMSASEE